jgi:WbqC-like protein family
MSRVVAVMQPYFAPYTGYYRLLAAADVFVLFDCVQFPRRGWVHRNRLPDAKGESAWLTLPLAAAPYDAAITHLHFAPDAPEAMAKRMRAFSPLADITEVAARLLHCAQFEGKLVDYLERQIEAACELFGFAPKLIRSSTLAVPDDIRGQARVLEICRRLDASDYVNAPGGSEYYDPAEFAARRIGLHFLPPHQGSSWSVLQRLCGEAPSDLAAEMRAQSLQFAR